MTGYQPASWLRNSWRELAVGVLCLAVLVILGMVIHGLGGGRDSQPEVPREYYFVCIGDESKTVTFPAEQ